MVQYLEKKKLEKYLKAMTTLDIIMMPKEEAWLRLIKLLKQEKWYAYVIDNGAGDNLSVIFTPNGVLIKGFDHENKLNQFGADQWDNAFFEYTFNGLPKEFGELLDGDDRDNTTFCMWCMDNINMWIQNEIDGNDGGKDFLLGYIYKDPEEWIDWAKYYYNTEIAQEVVHKVYNEEKLTEEDVLRLNSTRDIKEVFAELDETF